MTASLAFSAANPSMPRNSSVSKDGIWDRRFVRQDEKNGTLGRMT
jgi:hypothetical protein